MEWERRWDGELVCTSQLRHKFTVWVYNDSGTDVYGNTTLGYQMALILPESGDYIMPKLARHIGKNQKCTMKGHFYC